MRLAIAYRHCIINHELNRRLNNLTPIYLFLFSMKKAVFISVLFFYTALKAQSAADSAFAAADSLQADSGFARQVMDTALVNAWKPSRKWNVERVRILLGVDYSYYNPLVIESDRYSGPYYPVPDSAPVWTDRNAKSNLSSSHSIRNIQFSLKANFWKGLFIGMNYQFFSVRNYKKDVNLGNLLSKVNSIFFLVSADFGYAFELLKNKSLQIEPSVRIGGYTADDYYDRGTGHKFYFGADCRIRYLIKRKFGFSVGVDYDFIRYKKKGYSDIFQRDTYQKTTFNNIHLNAGICYNITIRTQK
jgi:hypothetical protein